MICLFLRLFGKTPIVYLRSDGYGEYNAILGSFGKLIYHLMFSFISLISNLISCRNYILKGKKGKTKNITSYIFILPSYTVVLEVIYPSQLDSVWFKKT